MPLIAELVGLLEAAWPEAAVDVPRQNGRRARAERAAVTT
jgi:hypothetical protein